MTTNQRSGLALLFLGAVGIGCDGPSVGHAVAPGKAAATDIDPLQPLREFESARRSQADFAHLPASNVAMGADPYAIVHWDGAPGFVGVLRGRDAVVELDESLREVGRLAAPASPSGLATDATGEVWVVGELSHAVARYVRDAGHLRPAGTIELPDVRAMRDVATSPEGLIYIVEEHDGRLVTLAPGPRDSTQPAARVDLTLCHGPMRVRRVARSVVVDCLLDHAIEVLPVDARGVPSISGETRIVHDGPMWGFDAVATSERGIVLAVGGVEDHPLDRTQGSFGFIDSFVTLYELSADIPAHVSRRSEVNTSALGLVTPKALALQRDPSGTVHLAVAGYATDRLALFEWPEGAREPAVSMRSVLPGTNRIDRLTGESFVLANPLFDAWIRVGPTGTSAVAADDDLSRARSTDLRVGEALFFTTAMAPWNKSDGRLSRFTCETCHYEGYVDGRTHATGRGDVRATTKPLLGLFNNRPHFSRALDPNMATMVDNEFRVAGSKSDHDPWFALGPGDFPWLQRLGVQEPLAPDHLRRALMTFFMQFTHRPNPSVVGRTHFSDRERAGAEVFRDRCESCHQARLVADDASTRTAFGAWEPLVMAPEGAIVWAKAEYEKTGVLPYVNEKGARVVSLRRLYKKHPYFTNGSAPDLADVVDRAQFVGDRFVHEGILPHGSTLSDAEKRSLLAFLDLL